jgi:hypothetical protein
VARAAASAESIWRSAEGKRVVELLGAMARGKPLCDAYTRNFNHPDRQWEALASPERTAAFIARHSREEASINT